MLLSPNTVQPKNNARARTSFCARKPTSYRILRPPHTSRFFVAELQIFCRARICRDISLPHTSRFFVVTNRVQAWDRVIQIKMAPTRRILKLALFTLAFLRWLKRRRNRGKRNTWVKSWLNRRNEQGVYNNLIQELGNEDPTGFRWYFRLSKENFQEILALLSHDITKANTKMRSSISDGERLSIALRFLATGE